jgi:hypothetical protein
MLWLIGLSVVLVFGLTAFFGAPYVPSQRRYMKRAFESLYPLSSHDTLIDIGAGDGRVLRLARTYGAHAIGYEINPLLWLVGRFASRRDAGVAIRLTNFWSATLPDETTVVYAFSVERDQKRLAAKLQHEATRLNKTITLLSYGNPLNERYVPEATLDAYMLYRFHPLQGKVVTV